MDWSCVAVVMHHTYTAGGDASEPVSRRKPWILLEDALTKKNVEEK